MKTKTIKLYQFSELPDKVKAKVLDRERYINTEDGFWSKYLLEVPPGCPSALADPAWPRLDPDPAPRGRGNHRFLSPSVGIFD